MVFKLVRIDSPAPLKIDLTLGKHLIGRGKFLHDDESDKRVSRNHAELEVTEDSIKLKSLHQNPCFYIKRNTTETQLLQQDSEVIISNGDKFGLIPDHFWYEVLQIIGQNSDQNGCTIENKECPKNEEDEANGAETTDDATEPLNVEIKQEEPDQDIKSSQSLLNQLSAQEKNVEPEVPSRDMNSAMKRSPSTDSPVDVTVKKVKTEPDEAEDARPGPSNDQVGTSNADNDGHGSPQKPDTTGPASPQKPDGTLRERCMYGANCYRRNPAHKAQFSHPADSDWGAARRPRPRPPRPRPPHPPHAHGPPGKRRKPKNDYNSDEDSQDRSSSPNPIVTGKRSRKTIYIATWSGSDDEDADPYGTDESDEWQPPRDVTISQDSTDDF